MIDEEFRHLTGFKPFPWQARLARCFVDGSWRDIDALDIPTGLGKTSVMAVWLAARSHGAPTVPRRLVYIVDRRVVVDQATKEAEALGNKHAALQISTLRGQFVDNGDWLRDPSAPAIIVGTVDMIGSRLLFSGYGVGRGMRPVHAGMLGQDTLFVLDEAHLAPPFEALLRKATAGGDRLRETQDVLPAVHLIALSATQRDIGARTFALDDDDRAHPVVSQRIDARKLLTRESIAPKEFADEMVAKALAIVEAAPTARIVLFCDARKGALSVETTLLKARFPADRVALLTGARRVHEREAAANELERLGFTGSRKDRDDKPAILIATSAGEVGVDFDADHCVMDLVPWERLVQRLGRVNRRGECESSSVIVLDAGAKREDWAKKSGADPDSVRTLLGRLETDGDAALCGPQALRALNTDKTAIANASTPAPMHPPFDRATLDAWSLTSLKEHTGRPEIGPWLRGWIEEDRPQCAVIWRKHLPLKDTPKTLIEDMFKAAPPHLSEKLETEAWQVADWLTERSRELGKAADKARKSGVSSPFADEDIATIILGSDGAVREAMTFGDFLAVGTRKEDAKALSARLAATTLVVSSRIGGLSAQGMLDAKAEGPGEETAEKPWWGHDLPWRAVTVGADEAEGALPDAGAETLRAPLQIDGDEVTEWLVIRRIKFGADEVSGSARGRSYVALDQHNADVEERVAGYCAALGFSEQLTRVFRAAGRLHDLGKAAEVWQKYARAPKDKRPVAKSPRFGDPKELNGYRHEFGSLLEATVHSDILALPEGHRDLALHLIASHHGHARPFIHPGGGPRPAESVEGAALDAALRFARLQEEWGPWGLAWLESIMRAADRAASAEPSQEGTDG